MWLGSQLNVKNLYRRGRTPHPWTWWTWWTWWWTGLPELRAIKKIEKHTLICLSVSFNTLSHSQGGDQGGDQGGGAQGRTRPH